MPATSEPRAILGPAGNRVRVSEDPKRNNNNNDCLKNPRRPRKPAPVPAPEIPKSVVVNNVSVDSTCSSDSSSSNSSAKKVNFTKTVKKRNGLKPVKVVPDGVDNVAALSLKSLGPPKRCDWITPNSGKCF